MLEDVDVPIQGGPLLRLLASETGIRAIQFEPVTHPVTAQHNPSNQFLVEAQRQLRAYFARELRHFGLPLDIVGTEFQKRVWCHLRTIPYGTTRSYAQIAGEAGAPRAVRAVGAANGANPIPIVVPCHRVIGSNGKLTGYGGGLPLKMRLLELEGASLEGLTIPEEAGGLFAGH
jgi:methylated-DNA-[protein]-cysteine S-methyltransferase